MRVTFLGTGSAMPTGRRFQTGILVETDDGRLLVDCGSGVLHALQRTDVGYEGIDAVLLTHHHLDHVSDIDVLVKARWLAGAPTLTVAGPPGTTAFVDGLLDLHEYLQGRVDLTVRDVEGSFSLAGFDADSMETRHSMQCFAYRLTGTSGDSATGSKADSDAASEADSDADSGADSDADSGIDDDPSFVFSGDTEAFPELIEFADGAAVLAHDCSFPDDVDVSNHPTPSQLGNALAAADADIDRVYLTHFYPHTEGHHEQMLDSIATHYDGDVRSAHDGLTLTL